MSTEENRNGHDWTSSTHLALRSARASDHEYLALNDYANCFQAEVLPDDSPTPAEERITQLRHIPSFRQVFAWAA
jgi:hypothetical protein